jgi:hypothetical protein
LAYSQGNPLRGPQGHESIKDIIFFARESTAFRQGSVQPLAKCWLKQLAAFVSPDSVLLAVL